jgi:heme exporter protein D
MTDMLAMGGYGAYVWSSFALTLIVVVICVVQVRSRHQQVFSDIKTRLRAMEAEQ